MNVSSFRPEKLMCIVAHPDDIEVTIGGTVAKWASEGTDICLVVCTDGANGTADPSETGNKIASTRAKEQIRAAKTLGISCWHQLDFPDGAIELKPNLCSEIVRQIRAHKPDTVFTMDPTFLYSTKWNYPNHRDHRIVGQAVFDAVYPLARDVGSCTELLDEGLGPHAVSTIIMTNYEKQDCFVDVTNHFGTKIDSLKEHVSQFGDGAGVADKLESICRSNGSECGVELAEGFVKLDIFEQRS